MSVLTRMLSHLLRPFEVHAWEHSMCDRDGPKDLTKRVE
jgi:hypothetical protein